MRFPHFTSSLTETPQRIVIQSPSREGEISGVQTYIDILKDSLESDFNREVRVVSSKDDSFLRRMRVIVWADVVHVNSNDLAMIIFSKLLGKTSVLKVHHVAYQTVHYEYEPLIFRARLWKEFTWLLRRYSNRSDWSVLVEANVRLVLRMISMLCADRLISCSSFLARSCDFPKEIETVYNPAPSYAHIVRSVDARTAFVFVGRLDYDKGCDLLLSAASLLQREGHLVDLRIVGDGPELASLKELAISLELRSVVFLGKLDKNQVALEMANGLVLVCPSRSQDAALYTTVEAALVSTVSIIADVGGVPETAGPSAYKFSREDVKGLAANMLDCISNPHEVGRRGAIAKAFALTRFGPKEATSAFLEAI